jgi:hypothetical protein
MRHIFSIRRLGSTLVAMLMATVVAFTAGTQLTNTTTAQTEPTFAIDAGPSGNSATEVERIEDCVEVQTGDQFQMDIVVEDITDLLAWEVNIDYQPEVVTVVGQDVKMFQQTNEGSSVLDLSAKLPDDSGFHSFSAFDSADPEAPDSGTGVLARITLEAVGAGESPIRFGARDFDNDGKLDRGTLLRNVDTNIIGDENEDTFFDGEQTDALVVVDGDCPSDSTVAEAVKVNTDTLNSDDDNSTPWAAIAGGVAAVTVILLLAVAYLLTRRRGRSAA